MDSMNNSSSSPSRRPFLIAGAVAVVFLCLCLTALAASGGFYYFRDPGSATPSASVQYVLDVSSRMALPADGGGGSRLAVAQGVMAEVVRPSSVPLAGLRVFGSGATTPGCDDTRLVVPVTAGSQARIAQELASLENGPAPDSALAQAMIAAIRDLSTLTGPRSLVVVTGGQDSCQAEAGRLLAQEAQRAGIELRTFVIGFQVPPAEAQAIKEMALAGGALYLDAPDEAALAAVLEAVQEYVDNPTPVTLSVVEQMAPPATDGTPVAANTAIATAPPAVTAPDATAEPTGEPATAVPPATTATATPAVAAVPPTPAAGEYVAQTACDHAYFPMRQGATWTYALQIEGESFTWTWTVTQVRGNLENASAVLMATFDDEFTVTYNWQCTPEGIVSYDYVTFGGSAFAGEGANITFDVRSSEGVFLPAATAMRPGATWTNRYTVVMNMAIEGQSFATTSAFAGSYTAVALETVTVPAGTYEGLRVDEQSTMAITMMGQTTDLNQSGSNWYGYGVGWLRGVHSGDGETTRMELVNYSIPRR
jgi:hypothetical protein